MFENNSRATYLQQVSALFAALSLCSVAALPAQTIAGKNSVKLESTVDASIKPGDDFFAYANGAWLKATEIPKGKDRWAPRDDLNELTRHRIAQLLDDARSAPAGSFARKTADFRAAWLNEAAIEASGRAPLKAQLDSIDGITDKVALTRVFGRWMRADVDPLNQGIYQSASLLGVSVEQSIHGEKTNTVFLLQGGLGLADREAYLSAEPRDRALRAAYLEYTGGLLSFLGISHEIPRAEAVLQLETAIAQSHATSAQSANDRNADNVWTRAEFARRAPGVDWAAFFASAGLGKQESFVAWQPTAITGFAALIASQPLDVWKDYLRVHLVATYAEVLPHAVGEHALALQKARSGQSQQSPRAQRAIEVTQLAMSDALARMYVERYFPAEQKARLQKVIGNVTAAFIKRVEGATWMTPTTRMKALTKLRTLYIGIAYPDQWLDYSNLAIDPLDAVGNIRRVEDRNYRHTLARLGKPVDMKAWWVAPQTVGGVLIFQQNAYFVSAALLQAPKFDPAASDAATYGAIGAIMGHDVSHYVDALGADYETDGSMRRWWTADDSSHFQALAEPLVKQFSSYHPFPDAAIDGRLTLSENIADLAGLTSAFDAYRLSLGTKVTDKQYVRQQDREFFIAFAQSWRTKMNDIAMRAQLTNDHAPEMYRISTVRNLDAWYEAFDVLPGQRLFLEPKARVRIW
ncbi:MAG: M13 family metallopeptidase [Gemmatimonas sp.]